MIGDQLVLVGRVPLENRDVLGTSRVAERDECVTPQPARIVARHEEPRILVDERLAVLLEPRDEIDVAVLFGEIAATFLNPSVPRAYVLADIAPVDLRAEFSAILLGNRRRRLRPVRKALRRVERP